MRRFVVGLFLAYLAVFCGSTQVFAQKSPGSRDVNQRIQALRNKLIDFQAQRSNKADKAEDPNLIMDTFEVKGEKLVEEFEKRSDVAVTVLFHDSEMPLSAAMTSEPVANFHEEQIEESAEKSVKIETPHLESDSRLKRYEDLRQRVCLATRSIRFQASQINRQIARVQ